MQMTPLFNKTGIENEQMDKLIEDESATDKMNLTNIGERAGHNFLKTHPI